MLAYVFLILGLFLLAGRLAAFLPGLAVLQLAWGKRSPLYGVLGMLLLAAPLVLPGLSDGRGGKAVMTHDADFAYALCFFPGLLIVLYGTRLGVPSPRVRAPLLYLVALFLLTAIASAASKVYVGPVVFALLGMVLLAVAVNLESVLAARIGGALLLLAPVAATLLMALPRHLELNREMAVACASGAGLKITAPASPVSVIAMDMTGIRDQSKRDCPQGCFRPVREGWLAGIEVDGDGWRSGRVPPGLYRYQTRSSEEVKAADLPAQVKSAACHWYARSGNTRLCHGLWPIEAYTADYLVRRRETVPSFDGIYTQSFEIVERSSGEVVAQTTGFYMTDGNRDSLLAVPLHYIVPRDDPCAANGPNLIPFIGAFVEASRESAGQSSSR